MRLYTVYCISANCSTCFGWYLHPSSVAHVNCKYNIWHWSNRICYLPLSSTITEGSTYGSTSARCCNYSLHVLLMMGEGITRNMYSSLQKHNELYIVASCWTIKADSHIVCRAHAFPLPCRALIRTCHAALLPSSDSAVSFVNVRMVAGNIWTASPTV